METSNRDMRVYANVYAQKACVLLLQLTGRGQLKRFSLDSRGPLRIPSLEAFWYRMPWKEIWKISIGNPNVITIMKYSQKYNPSEFRHS